MTAATAVGEARELRLVDGLTRTQIVQYAGASGDYNPLHTDEVFARESVGLPGVFAHGMLTMGMTSRVLTEWFGAEHIVSYKARFAAQGWPGDTLIARATVASAHALADGREEIAVTLQTINQRDEIVLSGSAVIRHSPTAQPRPE
jgi:acyl dehydratase